MSMRVLFGGGGIEMKPLSGSKQVQKEEPEKTLPQPKPLALEEDVVQLSGSGGRQLDVEPLQLDGGLHDKALDAIAMLWVKQGELTEKIEATKDQAEQERLSEDYAFRLQQIEQAERYLNNKQHELALHTAEADLEVVRATAKKYSQQSTFVPEAPKAPTHGATLYRSVPVSQNPQLSEAERRSAFAASRKAHMLQNEDTPVIKRDMPTSIKDLKDNVAAMKADIQWYRHMSHIPEAREYFLVSSKKLQQLADLVTMGQLTEAERLTRLDYREYRTQYFDRNPMNLAQLQEIKAGGIIHPAPSVDQYLPLKQQALFKQPQDKEQKQPQQSPPLEKQKLVAEA